MKGGLLLGLLLLGLGGAGLVVSMGAVMMSEFDYQVRMRGGGEREPFDLWPEWSWRVSRNDSDFWLEIPKLLIEAPVVSQVNAAEKADYEPALRKGVAQARGSDNPGEPGLGFYFAHSSSLEALTNPKLAVFYRLGKLEAGDEVRLGYEGEEYEYRVRETRVVTAEDTSFLNYGKPGEEWVVLQTCWPVGTNARRLIVLAERV